MSYARPEREDSPAVEPDRTKPTRAIAEFAASLDFDDLPPAVVDKAKACFLDWLIVTALGSREAVAVSVERALASLSGFDDLASLIGRGATASPYFAALGNGMVSHCLDYDDMHVGMNGHPGAAVFPALLAVVEAEALPGEALLRGFAVGAEVCCRLGVGLSPGHYDAGWHATSTVGGIGAAMAVASAKSLDAATIGHAVGLAATQASGMQRTFGSFGKSFNVGQASAGGVTAVELAIAGVNAPDETLVGERGFAALHHGDDEALESALRTLGERFHMTETVLKKYASCYSTHAPIEAAINISSNVETRLNEVDSIEVVVSPMAASVAGITKPTTPTKARFSIGYCVAKALTAGRLTSDAFIPAALLDPVTRQLSSKVRLIVDPTIHHQERRARISIVLSDGSKLCADADVTKETDAAPNDWYTLQAKLAELPNCDDWKAALLDAVHGLETVQDCRLFIRRFFPVGEEALQ